MMIDIDMFRVNKLLKKAKDNTYLSGFDFSLLIQDLTISEGGYVLPTGNYENVNAEVALRLVDRINRHPLIWKLFFMVAQEILMSNMDWIDNADSYICPVCRLEVNSPAKSNYQCPRCGFIIDTNGQDFCSYGERMEEP